MNKLQYRKAKLADLPDMIAMLADDELGKTREQNNKITDKRYIKAFHRIDTDPNQFLMVTMLENKVVGTCHLTFMPSLTRIGTTRMQIEAVRVASTHRGQKIGEWMIQTSLKLARENHASLIQLTTDKKRTRAKQFYERLGFKATHEGMKYSLTTGESHE
jgi:ribosomal protein S18 acetylase RimI-like enzyme